MAAGGLGLALQGTHPAPQLLDQIGQADQVLRVRVQAALRLLLAAPELEDPGRLLDGQPPVLGARVQHLVEVSLGHDDVLGPAHAGVRQQFLEVEQAGTARR